MKVHLVQNFKMFIFACLSFCLLFPLTAFAETDVTDLVEITQSRLRYDRSAGTSSTNVSIKNISDEVLLTPIKLVIQNISDPSVSVANADGYTEDTGLPYIEFVIESGQLLYLESTDTKKVVFDNSDRKRFTYTLSIFSYLSDGDQEATKLISAELGGEIVLLDGTVLSILPGSIEQDETISIKKQIVINEDGTESVILQFEPDGLQFDTSASLILPKFTILPNQIYEGYLTSSKPFEISIEGEAVATIELEITEIGDSLKLDIPHFSYANVYGAIPLYLVFDVPTEYLKKGDIMYHMSYSSEKTGWIPGHVGLYLGENSDPRKTMVQSVGGWLVDVSDGLPVNLSEYGVPTDEYGDELSYSECSVGSFFDPSSRCFGVISSNAENWRKKPDTHIYLGAKRYVAGGLTNQEAFDLETFAISKLGSLYNWVGNFGEEGIGAYSCVGLVEKSYEYIGLNPTPGYTTTAIPVSQYTSNNLEHVSEITSNNSSTDRSVELYGVIRKKLPWEIDTHERIKATIVGDIPDGFGFDKKTGILSWGGPKDDSPPAAGKYEFTVRTEGTYDDDEIYIDRILTINIEKDNNIDGPWITQNVTENPDSTLTMTAIRNRTEYAYKPLTWDGQSDIHVSFDLRTTSGFSYAEYIQLGIFQNDFTETWDWYSEPKRYFHFGYADGQSGMKAKFSTSDYGNAGMNPPNK